MRKVGKAEQRNGPQVLLKGRSGVSHDRAEFLFLSSQASWQFIWRRDSWKQAASSAGAKKVGGTEGELDEDLSFFSPKFQLSLLKARLEKKLAAQREIEGGVGWGGGGGM